MAADWQNQLYFGDNLPVLREHIASESVDLVYLDPPFNSKATYNVLFKEQDGEDSPSQMVAFDDFWHWDMEAVRTYHDVVEHGPRKVGELLTALHGFLGGNDMMAYLTMMAARLVELHRVLKPTGSLYLHCDPTASHYLKLVLDGVFGPKHFRNEINWQRSTPHGTAQRKFGVACDCILFYARSSTSTWHQPRGSYRSEYVEHYYSYTDPDGRLFQPTSLLGHRGVNPEREWRGLVKPWRYPVHRLDELDAAGLIYWPPKGGMPRFKRYLDEQDGQPVLSLWTDIPPVNSQAQERLGYPTQKPEALLERIISASSNEGDLVLDPFCGCGTTVAVAERLHRRWIGIDITHLAISLMKNRLHDTFGPNLAPNQVLGLPNDLGSARALATQNRHQFEYWALSLVDARPAGDPKKGADRGIDGAIYFFDDDTDKPKRVIIQVKSGHVNASVIRDLKGVLDREKAQIGALLTLEEPTRPMRQEAAEAGMYQPPLLLPPVPRLQILTIGELLAGKKLDYPHVAPATFKRAARQTKAKPTSAQQTLLDNDE